MGLVRNPRKKTASSERGEMGPASWSRGIKVYSLCTQAIASQTETGHQKSIERVRNKTMLVTPHRDSSTKYNTKLSKSRKHCSFITPPFEMDQPKKKKRSHARHRMYSRGEGRGAGERGEMGSDVKNQVRRDTPWTYKLEMFSKRHGLCSSASSCQSHILVNSAFNMSSIFKNRKVSVMEELLLSKPR
ncbi:hypothetical protein BO82DRAFT_49039 [Aspergillus uvarum CBS 121591]|uniref:Uncharacterized protein n=1 Tax=Aspergillus uvarum CBS 121591 TaxID=1448315 RepID=A0A319CEW2_9EURO|nr:hypothetical protein BO82DRAFT_49039 [Aspergillus uvarum CBS 121591]PYH82970.1 hypothetical protein BO82DRAFT_49039 [Aspergillus uvarum CBS 121591]